LVIGDSMTTAKKIVLDAWKQLKKNNKQIRGITRENKKLEKILGLHFRARTAWRTMKKGKGN